MRLLVAAVALVPLCAGIARAAGGEGAAGGGGFALGLVAFGVAVVANLVMLPLALRGRRGPLFRAVAGLLLVGELALFVLALATPLYWALIPLVALQPLYLRPERDRSRGGFSAGQRRALVLAVVAFPFVAAGAVYLEGRADLRALARRTEAEREADARQAAAIAAEDADPARRPAARLRLELDDGDEARIVVAAGELSLLQRRESASSSRAVGLYTRALANHELRQLLEAIPRDPPPDPLPPAQTVRVQLDEGTRHVEWTAPLAGHVGAQANGALARLVERLHALADRVAPRETLSLSVEEPGGAIVLQNDGAQPLELILPSGGPWLEQRDGDRWRKLPWSGAPPPKITIPASGRVPLPGRPLLPPGLLSVRARFEGPLAFGDVDGGRPWSAELSSTVANVGGTR